jgi:hypothetical protein
MGVHKAMDYINVVPKSQSPDTAHSEEGWRDQRGKQK